MFFRRSRTQRRLKKQGLDKQGHLCYLLNRTTTLEFKGLESDPLQYKGQQTEEEIESLSGSFSGYFSEGVDEVIELLFVLFSHDF